MQLPKHASNPTDGIGARDVRMLLIVVGVDSSVPAVQVDSMTSSGDSQRAQPPCHKISERRKMLAAEACDVAANACELLAQRIDNVPPHDELHLAHAREPAKLDDEWGEAVDRRAAAVHKVTEVLDAVVPRGFGT
jgi:hypothetical protein